MMTTLNEARRSFRDWTGRRRARRNAIRAYYAQNYELNTELARTGTLAMSARL